MDLLDRLDLRLPLIVAPMAGGPTTPELVVASSKAGALGSLGAAYLSPRQIETSAAAIKRDTDRPFAINLFVPSGPVSVSAEQKLAAMQSTADYRRELKLAEPVLEPPFEEDFAAQFEAVLSMRPKAFSFVFGSLDESYLKAARARDIVTIGTATSLDEAQTLEAAGVDAITLQGIEAGGHRGIFGVNDADPEVPALELLAACRKKLRVPLIAAGGIMNRDHIRAALKAGAQAVQMGTAFLLCHEAGTSAPYRTKLLETSVRRKRQRGSSRADWLGASKTVS